MLVRYVLYFLKLLFVMLYELKRKFIGTNQIMQSVELVFKISCIKAFRFLGDENLWQNLIFVFYETKMRPACTISFPR
jgi:hypothetical protein